MNNNIKKYIVVIGIIIIIAIILLIRGCDSETPTIELLGDDTIVINQNEQFIDPGYDIVGTKNINNYYIDIDGYVNTNNMGKYLLKYYLYNKNGKLVYEKTREVIVLNKGISNITMVLKGDEEEYYFPGDYTDNGVEVYEGEKDISNQVIIDSNVNPNEVGEYIVKYQIVNGNDHKELIRKVNVINYDIERKIDEKNYMISLIIKCGGYSHTILPDGIATYSEQVVYFYTTVGQYNFDI